MAALARNLEGSINPGVAQWQLGVHLDKPVGPGLNNLSTDVDMLAQALQYEGLATDVTSDPKSKLPAVIAGLSDLKSRILTGVRPEGPRIPGGLEAASSGDFAKVKTRLDDAAALPEDVLLDWPRLLAAKASPVGVGSPSDKVKIFRQIAMNRDRIPIRPGVGLAFGSYIPPDYHQGIAYTRSKDLLRAGAEPRPRNLTEGLCRSHRGQQRRVG